MKEKYVKVCPRCGSTNVSLECGGHTVWDFCKDCNFGKLGKAPLSPKNLAIFPFHSFPEVKESQLDRFRKRINKKPIT